MDNNLNLDKVAYKFEQVKDDQEQLVIFAKEIIPRLIREIEDARLEVVKALLGELHTNK